MNCTCIGVYRKQKLDESSREILKIYQRYVIEDTCGFSIEPEWHMISKYTDYEKEQLTEIFGCFPDQVIWIFGECDRIFVAAFEIIERFGGLSNINLGGNRKHINSYPGIKVEIHKKKWRNPLRHEPDYWLVDHIFIKEFFAKISGDNFEKFKISQFLPYP
jgi:hypothetical protein